MELILVKENTPLGDIFTPENVDAMIEKLENYKNDFKPDVTTAKGRAAIKSFSRKFSTSKVFVDEKGKELIEDWQTKTKAVNAQRKRFRESCDQFRDESRQPVTDFENAEKALIENQNRIIARLVDLYNVAGDLSAEVYGAYIAEVSAIVIDGDILSDFYTRGNREKEQTLNSLNQKLNAKIQHDKDQAELAKHREEQAERQKKEAAEQEEKERKAREKDIKAQAKKDSDAKAKKKIAGAKEAEERAKKEKAEAEERAEIEKREAKEKAEKEKKEAVAAAEKKAREEAEQKERDRLAKEERERKEAEKKAANQEHRAKIKAESTRFIRGILGTTEEQANAFFDAIANNEVPHIKVKF